MYMTGLDENRNEADAPQNAFYSSKSPLMISSQGNPSGPSTCRNGSGSNSSTLKTPGFFQSPLRNIIEPTVAGTPVV